MRSHFKLGVVCLLIAVFSAVVPAEGAELKDLGLEVRLTDAKVPLRLGAPEYVDKASRPISITRADLLVSAFSLRREDGSWLETAQWYACFRHDTNRIRAKVEGVPVRKYTAIRFVIGLDARTDQSDPNQYPAEHPLNPLVNGMHWGWLGGYIFSALEGQWTKVDGSRGGFSYHLAGEPQRMTIELPVDLDVAKSGTVQVNFDIASVMRKIDIAKLGDSTHSRNNDPRATAIRKLVQEAFSIGGLSPETYQDTDSPAARETGVGTPYPLQISKRLPQVTLPPDNIPTLEGVSLGKRLFHETKLSSNDKQSCASCHGVKNAFTDHSRRFSIGVNGDVGTRNSMPLFNLLWQKEFFWDGRAPSLRAQALIPIEDPHEMAASLPKVVTILKSHSDYPDLFAKAFGSPEITKERIGLALEQFQTTLISQESKFDRALRKADALTPDEQRGLQLFLTEHDPPRQLFGADCFHCHGGNLFTNSGFSNNGLDADPLPSGRASVTKQTADQGKFRVPSLRNIALTAPYMHDGRFATLEEVVDHYNHGVKRSSTLDPNLAKHPKEGLGLSAADKKALVAFLKCLTDEEFVKPR